MQKDNRTEISKDSTKEEILSNKNLDFHDAEL